MKIVFMGTPDISVPTLETLVKAGHEVALVVTQPDKPRGRGKEMQFPPVKETALKYDLKVYQPQKVRKNQEFMYMLKEINPDVIVVIAFGQILTKEILDVPKYGCVNIHASLLPKYRGAAPIQWVIIDGEKETGLTTMRMTEGLDTGDMYLKTVVPIEKDETGGSLFDKMAAAGGPLILETLKGLEEGTLTPVPQEGESNYAGMLTKELGNIDWTKDAESIERLIRGLNPWPSAYTFYGNKTLKIWRAEVSAQEAPAGAPGEIINVSKDGFTVQTGKGGLTIKELQLEGKKRMETSAFLRGYAMKKGESFLRERV